MAVSLLNDAVFYFEGGLMMSVVDSIMPIEIVLQTSDRFLETGIYSVSLYNEFELFQTVQQFKQLRQILEDSLSSKHKVYFIFPGLFRFCENPERKILIGIKKIDQILNILYQETSKFGISLQYDIYGNVICKSDTLISYWIGWWEEYTSTLTELDWTYFILCKKEQKIPVNLYPQKEFQEYVTNQRTIHQKRWIKKFKN